MNPIFSIILFSSALICGIAASQVLYLESHRGWLYFLVDTLLAYIMMEVGLEFKINKKKWRSYLVDYGVASLAAGLPWIFCFLYFLYFGSNRWEENLLLARFAAPTATGILFTMLGLAGLGATWLFKKIEVLVILDDLDTVLFLIPIQLLLSGGRLELISVALVMILLIVVGWRYMHSLKLPASRPWLFCYAIIIGAIAEWLDIYYNLEVEVILPAFILGLVLYTSNTEKQSHRHEHLFIEPEQKYGIITDRIIKLVFMFLVGLLLPKITIDFQSSVTLGLHILAITFLMCLGKFAPAFFYKKQASFRERIAVSIGMMPRGEMGAGILTIALAHGIKDTMAQVASLSYAVNLFLTGFFIWIVMKLLQPAKR